MAVELERFIDKQLRRLRENHPDKKFLNQVRDEVREYSDLRLREKEKFKQALKTSKNEIERKAQEIKISEEERNRRVDMTINLVSEAFQVPKKEIFGPSRFKYNIQAKKAISHILYNSTDLTLLGISKILGYKDHTTVLHHLNTTGKLMQDDEIFGETVLEIMNKITEPGESKNGDNSDHPALPEQESSAILSKI